MNVLEHLREWWESSDEFAEKVALERVFSRAGDPVERMAVGSRIADLLESFADRMDRSELVRRTASVKSADERRAEAALWRQGVDPHA